MRVYAPNPKAPSRILEAWLLAHPESIPLDYHDLLAVAVADGVAPFTIAVCAAARDRLPADLRPKRNPKYLAKVKADGERLVIDVTYDEVRHEADGVVTKWDFTKFKVLNTFDAIRDFYWSIGWRSVTVTYRRGTRELMTIVMQKSARKRKGG